MRNQLEKTVECTDCNKRFKTTGAMHQHRRATHDLEDEFSRDFPVDANRDVFEMVAGDLPDGAYFAMAEDFGLSVEDLID